MLNVMYILCSNELPETREDEKLFDYLDKASTIVSNKPAVCWERCCVWQRFG